MSNLFNNPAAFAPFFDPEKFGTEIVVEGVRSGGRSVKGTFRASVFDNGLADPFGEGDVDSSVRTFAVAVRAGDWIERTPPQAGDTIRLEWAGISYRLAVKDVAAPTGDTWEVSAREVKK